MPTVIEGKVSLPLPANASCTTVITTCTNQSGDHQEVRRVQHHDRRPDGRDRHGHGRRRPPDHRHALTNARALVASLEGKRTAQIDHRAPQARHRREHAQHGVQQRSGGGQGLDRQQQAARDAAPVGASTLPPENAAVRCVKAHPGMVEASCAEEQSVVGYAFQMGTDADAPRALGAAGRDPGPHAQVRRTCRSGRPSTCASRSSGGARSRARGRRSSRSWCADAPPGRRRIAGAAPAPSPRHSNCTHSGCPGDRRYRRSVASSPNVASLRRRAKRLMAVSFRHAPGNRLGRRRHPLTRRPMCM